jgi:hypothetical protein
MGGIRKLFLFFFTLGFLCLGCYAVPYVVFASIMVDSMPVGKEQGEAWLRGTPQPAWEDGISSAAGFTPACKEGGPLGCASSSPVWDGEQVPYSGFAMPADFKCTKLVESGILSDVFGSERQGCNGPCKRHSGTDFATNGKAVPVYTPMGGLVTWADWDPQWYFGQFVAVESNGYQVLFAHLSRIDVRPGEIVHAGQQIGLTGSTGNSTGVHLHIEVRVWNGGRWVPINLETAVFPGQSEPCRWRDLVSLD